MKIEKQDILLKKNRSCKRIKRAAQVLSLFAFVLLLAPAGSFIGMLAMDTDILAWYLGACFTVVIVMAIFPEIWEFMTGWIDQDSNM